MAGYIGGMEMRDVVTKQPLPGNWHEPAANVPKGDLEFLASVDMVVTHIQADWVEGGVFDGHEENSRYAMKTKDNKHLFYSVEDSGCCIRYWCGSRRPFGMKIVNKFNQEVIHFTRPLRCEFSCLPQSWMQAVTVESPPGVEIGTVQQIFHFGFPRYRVADCADETLYYINGPFITHNCFADPEFTIESKDGKTEFGKISQNLTDILGEGQEHFEFLKQFDSKFLVSFPLDMEARAKALLLAGSFLINFIYYEYSDYDEY